MANENGQAGAVLEPAENKLKIGSLIYTKASLAVLFGWLLWGDFVFTLFESIGGPGILTLYLQDNFRVSNLQVNIIFNVIPQLIGVLVGPVLSFKSDRRRGRMGRRIPYMIWTTPFLCLFAAAIGYSDDIIAFVKANAAEGGFFSPFTLAMGLVSFLVIGFSFFNEFVNTVYWYLFADVVPRHYMGRFLGLFRVVGAAVGFLINVVIAQFQLTHMRDIHVWVAILYFVGFSLMCWRVKEGEYPPVEDTPERRDFGPKPWYSAWIYQAYSKLLSFFAQVKLYFRECFTHPIFIMIYLSTFTYALARAAGGSGVFNLQLSKHVAMVKADIGPVNSLAMTPSGEIMLTAGEDGRVQLWDGVQAKTPKDVRTLVEKGTAAKSSALTPDGKTAFTGLADGAIAVWEVSTGKKLRTLEGHQGNVLALAVSPDCALLASGGADQKVRLWDVQGKEAPKTLEGHTGDVRCVAFSSDGKQLASGGTDKTIRIWDASSGQGIRKIESAEADKDKLGAVYAVGFAPSLTKLPTAGKKGITGFRPLDVVLGYFQSVFTNESLYDDPADRRAGIVAENGWLLAGGQEGGSDEKNSRLRIFDTSNGNLVMSLKGHKYAITSLQYKPDLRMILTGDLGSPAKQHRDCAMRLWDPVNISSTATDQSFRTISGYAKGITSLASPQKGPQMATGTLEGKLHLWNVDKGVSLYKAGRMASFFNIIGLLLAYPLGWLVDKWHPIRITLLGSLILIPIPFVSYFVVHDYLSLVWLEAFKVPIFGLVGAAGIPLLISIFPKEKFGQMCSANGLVKQGSMLALGPMGAIFMDAVTEKTLLTDNFRYGFFWQGIGFILYVVALWGVYLHWKRLGGDKGYVPPESSPASKQPAAQAAEGSQAK